MVDERTVRFHLQEPEAPFVVDVIAAIGILEKKTCADRARCRWDPQGAGAWRAEGEGVDRFFFSKRSAREDLEVRVIKDGTARLLAVAAGEILALTGPSGSGKTTLCRIVAGLEQPDEGVVTLGGLDVTQAPCGRRRVALMFEAYALYPQLSVFDNVASPLRAPNW